MLNRKTKQNKSLQGVSWIFLDLATSLFLVWVLIWRVQFANNPLCKWVLYIRTWKKPHSLQAWCNFSSSDSMPSPESKQWKSMTRIWGKGVWEVLWDENGGSCSGRRYRGGTVVSESFASSWTEGTNRELPRLAASPGSSMYSWEWDLWRENLRLIGLASNVSHLPLEAQIHEDHDLGVINMYMEIRGYDTDLAEDWQRICGGHIIEYWSGW